MSDQDPQSSSSSSSSSSSLKIDSEKKLDQNRNLLTSNDETKQQQQQNENENNNSIIDDIDDDIEMPDSCLIDDDNGDDDDNNDGSEFSKTNDNNVGDDNVDNVDDNDGDGQQPNNKQPNKEFDQFIQNLNFWVWQCQTWMYFHGAYQTRIQQQQQNQQQQQQQQQNSGNLNNHSNLQDQSRRSTTQGGIIMKLPSIRKRFLATIIDYIFIHFICDQFRVLMTQVWDYEFPFVTMDLKEIEFFLPEDDDTIEDLIPKMFWIYVKTIQYATFFYLFYLIYETMFLYGWPNRAYPGATIGKRILGLRVVSCESLEPIRLTDDFLVRVSPGGRISFLKAFLRTFVKLLPISNTIQCVNILSSRYNRSYFDQGMNCIVVDIQATMQAANAVAAATAAAAAAAANAANTANTANGTGNDNINATPAAAAAAGTGGVAGNSAGNFQQQQPQPQPQPPQQPQQPGPVW